MWRKSIFLWSKRTPGYVFWRERTLMDLETSQRGYLFAGGTKSVPLGEIVRRMMQVKARYHETSDVGERTLLRGEYKYFTGKPCDLRAARTADIVVYLECSAFFGFWDVGQVDRMLEVLHHRSMSLWLDPSSSSSVLPGADEIDKEELRRLLLCLPTLRKDGSPLYGHLTALLSSMLSHSSHALSEEAVLSPEEACELFLASTAQTPRALLLGLLPVVGRGVRTSVFSLSILVELFDALGSLLLAASSNASSMHAVSSSSSVLEAETSGEEREKEVRRIGFPLFTLLRDHLFTSRDQLDPLELAITYHATIRWQEEIADERKRKESFFSSSSSSSQQTTSNAMTHEMKMGANNDEKKIPLLDEDDVFFTHQAFLHSFVTVVGSAHTMCPRAAAIFFSAFSMGVAKERHSLSTSSAFSSSLSPPPLALPMPLPTSSSFPKEKNEEAHRHHRDREEGEAPPKARRIHEALPGNRSHTTKEVEGNRCHSLVSCIPPMAELLGPRMIYLAVEFTPAELMPILEVWMEAVVHHFVVEASQCAFLPYSSSIPLGNPQHHYTTTTSLTRPPLWTSNPMSPSCLAPLPHRLLLSSPPSSVLHVVRELLEQLRVLLTEATSFFSSSTLFSWFSFLHRVIHTMAHAVDHRFSASRIPTEESEGQRRKPQEEEHRHHIPLSPSSSFSQTIHTPFPSCTTKGAVNASSSLRSAGFTPTTTAVEVVTAWFAKTIPTLPLVWKSMSEKVPAMCQRSSTSSFSKAEELQYLLSLPSCLLQESSKRVVRQALRTRFPSTSSCSPLSPVSPQEDVVSQ